MTKKDEANERIVNRLKEKFLKENSLFTNDQEKKDLLANDNVLADAFVFSFLGSLGAFSGASNPKLVLGYFKKDKKLRPTEINQDNNDTSLIIKLLHEKKVIRLQDHLNQITKFLVKMKMGTVTTIDETYIREWLANMKVGFFQQNLSPEVRKIYRTYVDDPNETLPRLAYRLFKIRNKFKEITGEFSPLALRAKFTKIPEIDQEYDESGSSVDQVATQPVVEPVIQEPQEPVKTYEDFPYTSELMYNILMISVSGEIQEELVELFIKGGIVDISRIREAFDKANLSYDEQGARKLFWSNLSEAMAKLDSDSIRRRFSDWYHFSVQYDEIPDELVEIFRKNEQKLLVEKHLYQFYPNKAKAKAFRNNSLTRYYLELNDKFIEKIYYVKDASGFLDVSSSSNMPVFSNGLIAGNLFLRVTSYHVNSQLSASKMFGWYDYTGDANRFFEPVVKYHSDFDADEENFVELEKSLESFVETNQSPIEDKLEAIGRLKNIAMGNYVIFKLPEDFSKKIVQACVNVYQKHADKALDKIFEWDPWKDFYRLNLSNLTKPDPILAGKDFYDKVIEKAKEFPDGTITMQNRKNILILRHRIYDNDRGFKLDDPKAEIEWYKKNLDVLNVTETQDKVNVYASVFLNNAILSTNPDKKSEFYFMVLQEIEKLNPQKDIFYSLGKSKQEIFNFLIQLSKDQTLEILKSSVENPDSIFRKFFDKEGMKGIKREEKAAVIETFANMFFDHAESHPDLIDKFYASLDKYQQDKVRERITAFEVLDDSFETGTISFLEQLSSGRIREILSYNNVSVADFIVDKLPRKSKFDTFTTYNKKIKDAIKQQGIKVPEPKVTEENLSKKELSLKNYYHILQNYAGKHGNVYPIFKRSFSVSLPADQYEEFTQRMKDLGIENQNIIPSYHGTGGIGASMILRFGFRIIKDSAMTTGKMLGNGVYFSNKIDKACQYVGNSGFTRKKGTRGYILQMDSQLGKNGKNYKAAGLESWGPIRSPEWCVFEPNHQLKILTAYEVVLGDSDDFAKVKKESGIEENSSVSYSGFLLNERMKEVPEEQIRFVFYDNQVILDDRQIYWASDVESYGDGVIIERDIDGTSVTFLYTKTTETHEIAFAAKIKPAVLKKYLTLLNTAKKTSGLKLKTKKNKAK
jgi:hypothetical protein